MANDADRSSQLFANPDAYGLQSGRRVRCNPYIIALGFAVYGVLWLTVTDPLLHRYFQGHPYYIAAQTLKGVFYVLTATAFVFWLARGQMKSLKADLTQDRLNLLEDLFTAVLDCIGEAVIVVNAEKRTIVQCNSFAEQLFGYDSSELIGRSTSMLHVDQQQFEIFGEFSGSAMSASDSFRSEFRMRKKDGTIIETIIAVNALKDRDGWGGIVVIIVQDITDQREKQEQIRRSLEEKTILLREIHHRVQNNLSVIIGLLNLQTEKNRNNHHVVDALNEFANRIRSMALVHNSLYASTNLVELNMADYIRTLGNNLLQTLAGDGEVVIEYDCDDVALDISYAIPCGIILNELITNSLVHAFGNRRPGTIRIGLKQQGNGFLELTVGDDGPGLPDSFNVSLTDSLGFHLVHAMADQINGSLFVRSENGARITVGFQDHRKRENG